MKKKAADTASLLHIQDLSYSINGVTILQDISLTISPTDLVSIIGYNGSGKSTLLKLMLGSLIPTTGTVTKQAGTTLGYVPQKLSFREQLPLTVADFLASFNPGGVQQTAVPCELLDVTALLPKKLSALSGGQLQKVLIYNALIGNPEILLLDEPTAGLDVVAQQEFYELIDHIHQAHGIAIVLVSHDIHVVYSKSDRVICLHQGVCCTGCPHTQAFATQVNEFFDGNMSLYLHKHTQHQG